MKILGVGVDIIENKRIKNSIKSKSFITRTFGVREIKFSKKFLNKSNFLAKDLQQKSQNH